MGLINRESPLKKFVPFNEPVAAGSIHVGDSFQKIIRPGPDQYAMGIVLDIVIPHLKLHSIFHGNARLAVAVDLVLCERAIA